MYVASYVGEGKVWDTSLAFGAETGEVSDEALPKEIILLYLTGLRDFVWQAKLCPGLLIFWRSLVHGQ